MSIKTKLANEVGRTAIDSWTSDDGSLWYRKWSDGWIEQGGIITLSGSTKVITYPISFVNINYILIGGLLTSFGGASNPALGHLMVGYNKTLNSFTTNLSTSGYGQSKNWYACGY